MRQKHLNQALMRIPRRAESTDRYSLASTYVAAGSFSAMLHSTDHQILYGRRGTGKTHALQFLSDLVDRTGDVPVYLDLRTIGSAGGMYGDSSVDTNVRGTHLLVDTLEAVHEELLTLASERDIGDETKLLEALDTLAEAATVVEVVGQVEQETRFGDSRTQEHGIELSRAPKISLGGRQSVSSESRTRRTGVERHHIVFGPLSRALRGITRALGRRRLWLLLDEWSSIPLDLQPLLADLLRRSVLPAQGITVKIAAIERRSKFCEPGAAGDYVGIEVGADAASAVSLDDVMIFDHTQAGAREFFAELFFNHAMARMPSSIGKPEDAESLVEMLFRGNAFNELVRAAEGVPRDAINIAALAAQHAHNEPIGIAEVRRAARDWYLRDKQTAISENSGARRMLRLLVDEVVGRRRSRTFVVDQMSCLRHETIDELYDARLLHVLRRGIVDSKTPGALYDGFAIDYGCYVSLLIDGEVSSRPRDKGGWLASPKSMPPDGFSLSREALDLTKLGPP